MFIQGQCRVHINPSFIHLLFQSLGVYLNYCTPAEVSTQFLYFDQYQLLSYHLINLYLESKCLAGVFVFIVTVSDLINCFGILVNWKLYLLQAAKNMFDIIMEHLTDVLLKDAKMEGKASLSYELRLQHDAFMASRSNVYVHGDAYMKTLNHQLLSGR